jgi:hypothetical protein
LKTKTQKHFEKQMKKIQKDASKNNNEPVYSYIEDDHITSYYAEKKLRNSFSLFRVVRVVMFVIISVIILLGFIGYVFSKENKLASIPMTLMFVSLTLLIFGLIHPKLAFFVKSRLEVIGLYVILAFVSFAISGIMLQ